MTKSINVAKPIATFGTLHTGCMVHQSETMTKPIKVAKPTAIFGTRLSPKDSSESDRKGVQLGAVNGRKQKWSLMSQLKNFFIEGRKEQKLAERNLIAMSVKQATPRNPEDIVVSTDFTSRSSFGDGSTAESEFAPGFHRNPISENPLYDPNYTLPVRVFNNPLYNAHLDNTGDSRLHSEIVKKANGQHLLDALHQADDYSNGALRGGQVLYFAGKDKAEVGSQDKLIDLLGEDAASHFSAAASGALAEAILGDIHQNRYSSASIPVSHLISMDWTFERHETGQVTASYLLNFSGNSLELAWARGSVELAENGKLQSASRIVVSGLQAQST